MYTVKCICLDTLAFCDNRSGFRLPTVVCKVELKVHLLVEQLNDFPCFSLFWRLQPYNTYWFSVFLRKRSSWFHAKQNLLCTISGNCRVTNPSVARFSAAMEPEHAPLHCPALSPDSHFRLNWLWFGIQRNFLIFLHTLYNLQYRKHRVI